MSLRCSRLRVPHHTRGAARSWPRIFKPSGTATAMVLGARGSGKRPDSSRTVCARRAALILASSSLDLAMISSLCLIWASNVAICLTMASRCSEISSASAGSPSAGRGPRAPSCAWSGPSWTCTSPIAAWAAVRIVASTARSSPARSSERSDLATASTAVSRPRSQAFSRSSKDGGGGGSSCARARSSPSPSVRRTSSTSAARIAVQTAARVAAGPRRRETLPERLSAPNIPRTPKPPPRSPVPWPPYHSPERSMT